MCDASLASTVWVEAMKTSPPRLPSPPPRSPLCTSPGPRIGSTSTPGTTTGPPTNASCCISSRKTWLSSPPREDDSFLPILACITLICTHQFGPGNMSPFQRTSQQMSAVPLLSMNLPRPSSMNLPRPSSMNLPRPSSMSLHRPSSMNLPRPSSMSLHRPSSMSLPRPSSMNLPRPSSMSLPRPSSMSLPCPSSMNLPRPSSMRLVLGKWESTGLAQMNHLTDLSFSLLHLLHLLLLPLLPLPLHHRHRLTWRTSNHQ